MVEEVKKEKKRLFQGTVVSDKMDKTILVEFQRIFKHPHTSKTMRMAKKYKVHDEHEIAKVGDIVEFYEGRPLAKTKYMYLSRVVS
jgi:small subunit ribosomal protein S17